MGKSFRVRTTDLEGLATRTGQRHDQVNNIAQQVGGTSLHGAALGSIGASTTSAITSSLGQSGGAVSRTAQALDGARGNLNRTAQNYHEADQRNAETFKRITTPDNPGQHLATTPSSASSGASHPTGGSRSVAPPPTFPGGGSIKDHNQPPTANGTPLGQIPTCGDPVAVTTGRMLLAQVDVTLAATLPLVLSRAHLSSYRVGRSFGPTWACTLDQRLEIDPDGISFAAEDGMLLSYPMPGLDGAAVLPAVGPRWPLARIGDLGFVIADPERDQVWSFANTGAATLPLTAIVDATGNRIDILRDQHGVPTEVRHSAGYRVAVDTIDGLITALHLRGDDGAATELVAYRYNEHRRLTEVVNSSGQPLRFDYDDAGRVVRWQDRNGMWYRYEYDADDRCVRTEGAGGHLSYTYRYDRENLVTTATNSLGHTTTYRLNERMRVIAETNPLGHTTESTWDADDRLRSRTDPLGATTRFEYDPAGNLTRVIRPDGTQTLAEYDATGRPVVLVEPDGAVWRREYDPAGRLTALVDPTGARTGYAHDDAGRVAAITDPLGQTTHIQSSPAGLPLAITDPLGATTRYEYDRAGRVATITDPLGGVTRFGWTAEGRPAWRTTPDGATERWRYDGEGNVRESTDAQGQVTRTEVAAFDLAAARTGPDGGRLAFGYDTELRLVSVTNPQGLVWRYEYDPAGNLVSETDFNGRRLRYTYAPDGQLVETVNGLGQVTRLVRDAMGRVVEQHAQDGVTTFDYDQAGRLLRAVNADADVSFRYDPCGRVLAEVCNGRAVLTEYDAAGRRVRRRTPGGVDSAWAYDAADRPTTLTVAGHAIAFHRDQAGRELARRFGQQVALTQDWDVNHRLSTQAVSVGTEPANQRLVQRRAYRYRTDGNLTAIIDQAAGRREFTLDALGRATEVRGAGWTERYAYDPAGNIASADWTTDSGSTGGAREYVGTLVRQAGDVRYQHDQQGRVVARTKKRLSHKPDTWHYEWNADDRLVGVLTPDGQRWRYRYDAFGRRIAKQRLHPDGSVAAQTDFTWDGETLVEQHTAGHTTTWDYQPGGFTPLSQFDRAPQREVDARFYAIVTDLVGTPTELVDETGALAWQARTTLWGRAADAAGPTGTPLRFPGQYFDRETGFHYNFQRHYDPATGRYLSVDPLGLAAGPNPHAYVPNPTGWSDPLGLFNCMDYARMQALRNANSRTAAEQTEFDNLQQQFGALTPVRKRQLKRLHPTYLQNGAPQPPLYEHPNPEPRQEFHAPPGTHLYHYTTAEGYAAITGSANPELWASHYVDRPTDSRLGNGQYFSTIRPHPTMPGHYQGPDGTVYTAPQVSQIFYANPNQTGNLTHFIQVDPTRLPGTLYQKLDEEGNPTPVILHQTNNNLGLGGGVMTDHGSQA